MAKYSPEKVAECVKWVETNGLYPQRCGAPVKDFCRAMGIGWDTLQSWYKKSEFADAIKKANEFFAASTVQQVSNALKNRALGYTIWIEESEAGPEKIIEYDPKTGKKVSEREGDKLVTKKAKRKQVHVSADVAAAVFLLTNLDGERWKNPDRWGSGTPPPADPPRELTKKEAKEFRDKIEKEY